MQILKICYLLAGAGCVRELQALAILSIQPFQSGEGPLAQGFGWHSPLCVVGTRQRVHLIDVLGHGIGREGLAERILSMSLLPSNIGAQSSQRQWAEKGHRIATRSWWLSLYFENLTGVN